MDLSEIYGSLVFDDKVMKQRLPSETYNLLKDTIRLGRDIDINIANVVANAMKDWAIENGATHYTHWFQPMTGLTAEKHDSFISTQKDGTMILAFSGKELIKGEPDASSFPSGGLRATFEARGYTAWDPTSFAFIKEKTLCIPTAFCSYSGEVLDKKTPLLKSMEVLNTQALRVLKLFGFKSVEHVSANVGLEQEYFLVDKDLYLKRKDLQFCGRTLVGAKSSKGQELDDHYFGAIKPRINEYMKSLNEILWRYGIPAKTEHNETAPAQHELASIFSTVNLSVDRNLVIMEEMKKVADSMNLACILHEKPFEGINGSGKHNNWSLTTDTGLNLFEPGETFKQNSLFLLVTCAVIKAVDEYHDLLSCVTSSPSNDCRLGGSEAPPAIVSIYLGDDLTNLFESITPGTDTKRKKEEIGFGVHVLPNLPKDGSDRNRTSPVAFTGSKFEFRMLGSQLNASEPNVVINTAVAKALSEFADFLENSSNFDLDVTRLVKETYEKHKRIVFNGNNYSAEWLEEAKRRGLKSYKSTAYAALALLDEKNVKLFEDFGIFTKHELESRMSIILNNYSKTVNIEANVLMEMLFTQIIPAAIEFSGMVANSISEKKKVSISIDTLAETKQLEKIQRLINMLLDYGNELRSLSEKAKSITDLTENAIFYSSSIIPLMNKIRDISGNLEMNMSRNYWPFPTIEELLFSV